MRRASFAVTTGFLLLAIQAHAAEVTLYDGNGTPADEGWTRISGAGHRGGSVTETQIPGHSLEIETDRMRYHSYALDTGYAEFLVGARMRITDAQYNYADAGLMFSVLGKSGEPDRFSGVYLTPDHVGFMDLKDMAPIAAEQYHDFAILYRDHALSFYVDDSFQSIMDGTAVPELYRTDPIPSRWGNTSGVVQIGDQTNDFNVNSRYILENVRFLGITPVPEPETSIMFGAGLAFLAWAARRRNLPP
ncbi:MAG TPA: PEP-CTERM sorting domain-containing protein [Methylophilaceae bacterium]|nr:PEP-CTERM sorting domain-containing protein [Methylophilaceae bacterium]